ncbi:MAG: fibronectin type III domain-containing protein [Rhodanobacteraceae bacterium]|nr:fibronectin type III domain-containing protein [Rhodanobacteraceae bacterium]
MGAMAPIITRASYDGTSVKVWWTPSADPDVLGYTIRVSAVEGGLVLESAQIVGRQSSFGSLPLSGALNSAAGYTVEVVAVWSTGPGQISTALALLTALPQLDQVWYDGSVVRFEWVPASGAAQGYLIKIYSLDSGATYYTTIASPYARSGTIPASALPAGGLGASEQWVAAVCAQGASGISACSPGTLLPKPLPAFALGSASYLGGNSVAANWTALGAAFARYRILLESSMSEQRYFVDITGGTASGGVLALPAPLAQAQKYTLRVIALNAAGAGVATAASPVISALPQLLAADYDGSQVSLRWTDSTDAAVQGYRLSVQPLAGGAGWKSTVGTGVQSGTVATGALDPAQAYVATVAATATAAVSGNSTVLSLLPARPVLTAARYDTRSIVVEWTPSAGAQGYTASLVLDGAVAKSVYVANPLGSSATLALASPLALTGTARMRVTASNASGASARSADLDLLRAAPALRYITYDGSSLMASWQPVAGAASYELALVGASSGVRYSAQFNSGSASSGSLALPGRLGTQETYLYTLTARAASGAAVSQPAAILPTALPALESVIYDGATVSLRWSLPAGQAAAANGFRASVVAQSSGVTYSVTVSDPAAREASIALPNGPLDPAQEYRANVAALSPANASAQSPSVSLIAALPGIRYASYYGDHLTASWNLAGGLTPIANYRLSLSSAQDANAWSIEVPAAAVFATLGLPQALNAAQNYRVGVSAVAADGIAQALATAAPVVVDRPRLQSTVLRSDALALSWQPSTSLAVSGYTLKLISLSSGNTFTHSVGSSASSGLIALTGVLDPNQLWVAEVWANAPVAGVSDRTIVLAAQPVLKALRYDGRSVEAEWSAVAPGSIPGQSGYALAVVSAGNIVASVIVNGSAARIAVPDGTLAPQVELALAGPGSTGLATAPVNLLAQAPGSIQAATDAVTGEMSLSWTAVEGASNYRITRTDGSTIADTAQTQYTFATPLAANVPLSIVITPTATSGGVALTGPASLPFALPTAAGAIETVDYSVASLSLRWSLVPGASAYRISLLQRDATTPVQQVVTPDDATSYTFVPAITDFSAEYHVVVQALFGSNSGLPSSAAPLFTAGWYPSRAAATTYAPFLYPAEQLATTMSANLGSSGGDLTLYLPDIGAGTPLSGLPVERGPFKLDLSGDSDHGYPYKLVLSGSGDGNVWAFLPAPIRAPLAAHYVDFLKALEVAHVVPSGTVTVQQAIARYMPQTFQETLYYSYGLAFPDPAAGITYGYADLRPGMVLRVVFNDYMAVGGSSTQQWLNGYVGGAQIDYDVASYLSNSGWSLGFDAFIAQLVANGALSVTAPPTHPSLQLEGGSAEAADLFYPDFREPFYRLFFPTSLVSPSGTGTSQTAPNFVLAAAPSFTALSSSGNVPAPGAALAYFRGRAVVKLCIRVTINGNETVVPVGTTVANVLERYSRQPPIVGRELRGVQLQRALAPAVLAAEALPAQAALSVAQSYPVQLGWQTLPIYAPGWSALALPLLHGDRLTIAA